MSESMPPQDDARTGRGDLVDRFLELPVIWRSGVAAALVLLVVLVAEDYIWPMADDWNAQANRIEKIIDQGSRLDRAIDRKIERVATALGPIEVPRSAAPGATRLEETVGRILEENGLRPKIDARTGSNLASNSPIAEIAGGRVQRLVCELEFQSDPDTVIKVLRELEAEPEIESVSSVRLERLDNGPKLLDVSMEIEAWVVPERRGR